jgi:formylglycine-generating enzyme required for sulfatase activity
MMRIRDRITRRRALGIAALLAVAPGCRGRPTPATEVREAARDAPPASALPSPPPPAQRTPEGPCTGKRSGDLACDGRTLLRCGDAPGAATRLSTCLDIERCDAEHGRCAPGCPAGEVYVPPTGPDGFTMGRGVERYAFGSRATHNPGHGIADRPHRVVITRPFCMDATEVTVAAYAKCVDGAGCTAPGILTHWKVFPDKPDYPVNMVHWKQARHYCESVGEALPTEAQWEWAASGGDGRKWPWGDTPPTCAEADFTAADLSAPACDCGCDGGGASPVGTHPSGDKEWPSGHIHDLAGNVWEWCLDNYAPYGVAPETDPVRRTNEDAAHVVRGGGWNRSAAGLQTWFRGTAVVDYQKPALGFRCVRNPG